MFEREDHFIGGRWVSARGSEFLDVVSPSTEEVVGRVPVATTDEVDAAVAAARAAFDDGPWPRLSVAERAEHLRRFVAAVEARREPALRLQIDEMGMTHKFAVENFDGLRPSLERYVADAEKIAFAEVREGVVGKVLVLREPVGVVAGVTPWNSPIAVEVSKIFPALLMGCPIVVKPAPESPLSAYLLGEAAIEAGLPEGVLSIVNGGVPVGAHLVDHPGIDHVTFTGSTGGGHVIAQTCAARFRGVTLELGGKSAAVVLPGTDMTEYVPSLVGGSLRNSGQICVSTNRVIVHEDDRDRVVQQLVDHISAMKLGDPHEPDTDFGPLAAKRQLEKVEQFVASGRAQGAKVVLGGVRPADRPTGWYFEPTVFVDVDNGMEIAQEEIFGPVLSVITYSDEDEAIAIANDSKYGLGGAVFATDAEEGIRVATRIVTGTVQVNGGPPAGGGGPFAGRKHSGMGAERAVEGLGAFLELKSVTLPPGYEPAAV
ncbi:aldehyde dehydrogenase family protein [Amycolatopsis sp. FDAARGOS 1241]|uniref:aldehyde dehydrogenase family protein n=1 Tax=Amycolatopsis sp. FDAARGOS 1241 TaxID=2778070 RepID=UPI00194F8C62|nr:aldehyde dehydrogenase family protein [Amycolatopsis sp. FDAARGOS 1241]QRP42829.1 aldehyde dehydrogenase family protein [Amycolatopsis sp. FDAARGOS 1241]